MYSFKFGLSPLAFALEEMEAFARDRLGIVGVVVRLSTWDFPWKKICLFFFFFKILFILILFDENQMLKKCQLFLRFYFIVFIF